MPLDAPFGRMRGFLSTCSTAHRLKKACCCRSQGASHRINFIGKFGLGGAKSRLGVAGSSSGGLLLLRHWPLVFVPGHCHVVCRGLPVGSVPCWRQGGSSTFIISTF
jgi:hypothetical protein